MVLPRSRGSEILSAAAVLAGLGGASWLAFYWVVLRALPDLHQVADYRPPVATVIVDRTGRVAGELYEQRRRLVPLEAIPRHAVLAFVAGEDAAFFEHRGLDYRAMLRAAWVDLTAGEIRQGASTITQQTVKSLLLTPERRVRRKVKEMILARRLEERFTKDEILYLYLNQIYFGDGAWGIGEAARTYFDKDVSELSVSEAALLAGLPKAPARYSPTANPPGAEERRRYVLRRMLEEGYLDRASYEETLAAPPEIEAPARQDSFEVARWFTEEVRRRLFDELGGDLVLREGLTVETTLDLELQRAAVTAVHRGLEALDRRQGWHGPLRRVPLDAIPEELERIGSANGLELATPAAEFVPPQDRPLVGIVTAVEPDAQRARVALAPGIEGEIGLSDVSWARPRDPSQRPRPLEHIEDIFHVGDVARFEALPAESDGANGALPEPRLRLHQVPEVEGALLSLDVETGDVLALVGGYDFERSEFDRAVQARRQPGSAFKPVIYGAALARGYTPVSILYDRPLVYSDPESGFTWRPENYARQFHGPVLLRDGLARSINNATIHLLRDIGVDFVINYARRLGIRSTLARDLSLALGASPVSLLELTRALAVFATGGRGVVPVFIRRVVDRNGNVLLENVPLLEDEGTTEASGAADAELASPREEPEPGSTRDGDGEPEEAGRIVPETQAYLMTDLLRAVVEDPRGTGRRARRVGRPVGGKTGTTNDQADAWFVGFSPEIATGVWVGYDERQVLGRRETGARAALPVWREFMEHALAGRPVRDFPVPDEILFARIDRATGLLAAAGSRDTYFQPFLAGTEPTRTASEAQAESESRRLLRLDF